MPPAARGVNKCIQLWYPGTPFSERLCGGRPASLLYLGDYARHSRIFRMLLLITRMLIALDPDFSLEPGVTRLQFPALSNNRGSPAARSAAARSALPVHADKQDA